MRSCMRRCITRSFPPAPSGGLLGHLGKAKKELAVRAGPRAPRVPVADKLGWSSANAFVASLPFGRRVPCASTPTRAGHKCRALPRALPRPLSFAMIIPTDSYFAHRVHCIVVSDLGVRNHRCPWFCPKNAIMRILQNI